MHLELCRLLCGKKHVAATSYRKSNSTRTKEQVLSHKLTVSSCVKKLSAFSIHFGVHKSSSTVIYTEPD